MTLLWQAPAASLATLLGGWLVVRYLQGKARIMRFLSAIAAGYLISLAFVRIIPESLEPMHGGEGNALWVLAGFLLVHAMEHGPTTHFHYGEETHPGSKLSGVMALVGLTLHSLMDGMALGAAQGTRSGLGPLVFGGILLHRIPEGGTIASIFLVRGFGARGALGAASVLALAALLGAFGQSALQLPVGPLLGLTGGLGLYVASSDLLPDVKKESGWKSTLGLLAGVGAFFVSALLAPHRHGA